MKERIYYLDVLRCMAMCAVIILHVASMNWYGNIGSSDWVIYTIYNGMMRFCVPVFFMISGALFLNRDMSIKDIYKHNIFRMLVFLAVWSLVYQLYHLYTGHAEGNILWIAVKNIMKGDTQVHLWFVYAIIGLYVVSPVLRLITKHADQKMLKYILLIIFVTVSVSPLIQQWHFIQYIGVNINKMTIGLFSGYTGFFLLGYYLYTFEIKKEIRWVLYAAGVAGVVFTVVATWHLCVKSGDLNEMYFVYTMPNNVLWSTAIFVWVKYHIANKGKLSKAVMLLSNCSLGIYGIHMLVVFVIQNLNINLAVLPSVIYVPVYAGVVLAISTLLSWGFRKIPKIGKYIS